MDFEETHNCNFALILRVYCTTQALIYITIKLVKVSSMCHKILYLGRSLFGPAVMLVVNEIVVDYKT